MPRLPETYHSRLDLRLTPELSTLVARASALVGETDRAWARAALLRATCERQPPGSAPPSGTARLAIPLDPAHRTEIDAAVERSGMALSDWIRAVLERAAAVEISRFSAPPEKSTRGRKKDRKGG